MEPIYAVRSTYDEDMFYHQVVAFKPRMMPKEENGKKIRFQLPDPRRRFKLSERHVNSCSHKKRHQCILQSEIRELKPDLLSVFVLRQIKIRLCSFWRVPA